MLEFKSLEKRIATKYIILHHSASSSLNIEDIHKDHLSKGWAGIGYHYFIESDGNIKKCRPKNTIGAHCKGYNHCSIGICLQGNFEIENMTYNQMNSLRILIKDLLVEYPKLQVKLHKELNATKCPGKNFKNQIKFNL